MISEERPFYSDPWKGEQLDAARSIWDWRLAVRQAATGSQLEATDFGREADSFRQRRETAVVNSDLLVRVVRTIERFDLNVEYFAQQLEFSVRLSQAVRFTTTADQRDFLESWVYPHGRLLASLAKVSGPLYVDFVDSASSGFFLLGHLLNLPRDLGHDHLFIPEEELSTFGVSVDSLRTGPPTDAIKKLIWKQCVRVRDCFARSLPLSRDLPRRYRIGFRRWWLGGLEAVNAIERRKFDVWSRPIALSGYHRAQATFQARFARISFGH